MEDAALTQTVDKTRFVSEQCNGQMNQATDYVDSKIELQQTGLADLIVRSSFLLKYFKLSFIQETPEDVLKTGRPRKAEIRWHGGTDNGLVGVYPTVEI